MKQTFAFISGLLLLVITASAQNLKSPDKFLCHQSGKLIFGNAGFLAAQ